MRKFGLVGLFVLFAIVLQVLPVCAGNYIREDIVNGINTLTICDPDDATFCITMQDRNLGATTNDITSDKSYGYHFQWGNNHGFKPGSVNTQNHVVFPNGESTGAFQIDCSSYSPENPLDRDVFIIGEPDYFNSEFDYCDTHNYNLWGGGDDYYETNWGYNVETHLVDNAEGRQGPCPEGYHIPSNGEWQSLLEIWTKNYGNSLNLHGGQLVKQINAYNNGSGELDAAKLQFREDFKIPLAGGRSWYNAYIGGIGQTANFWSSSPYIGYDVVHSFSVGINSIAAGGTEPFANANSIRCFKNVPIIFSNDNFEKKGNLVAGDYEENTYSNTKNNVCNGKEYVLKNKFIKLMLGKYDFAKKIIVFCEINR